MARTQSPDRTVYVCVEGFSPATRPGEAPQTYRPGSEVLAGDPILETHKQFFIPAADRVERMTAAPGERRPIIPPRPSSLTDEDEE